MASGTRKQIKNCLILLTGLILSDCANQLPPGGGEVDKTPPEIIKVYPPNGTTNFKDDYFELEFSEYVERRSLQDAIFISPSIQGSLDLDWSGKSVTVNFPSKLKNNTTYVVTIGTDVVDYNNKNRMAESFNFTFSTGNEIDKRIIAGKVYNTKPAGILIFAYKLSSDTADPFLHRPEYISQTGNNGSFNILGLAEGTYRVFAVKDEYRDLLFQPEQDLIGMPYKDITFSKIDTLFSPLNFFLTKIDTSKPRFISASMTDRFHILINYTEEFDTSIIKAKNFYIFDSTSNKRSIPIYAFKGNTKNTEMVLVDTSLFPADHEVYLVADSIKDISGNVFLNDETRVNLSEKPDTAKLNVYKTIPLNNSRDIDYIGAQFNFYLNDAFNTSLLKQNVILQDTLERRTAFKVKILDDASFAVIPDKRLEPAKDYIIKFDLSKFEDAAGNIADTTFIYKFRTISGLDFTGISGKINNIDFKKNPVLVLSAVDDFKPVYTKNLNGNGTFSFDRVVPGKYLFWCYLDVDSARTYSYGYPFPFKPSEEFSFYPDTLDLRARWVQTDINFDFK
ncbi:MAG: Ig-like domain-containing protein [Ignavibacteriaceae bacterium]